MSRKQIVLRKPSQKQILSQTFSRKSAILSCHQNIFTKMVLLLHMLSFPFFVLNPDKRLTLVNIREKFRHDFAEILTGS